MVPANGGKGQTLFGFVQALNLPQIHLSRRPGYTEGLCFSWWNLPADKPVCLTEGSQREYRQTGSKVNFTGTASGNHHGSDVVKLASGYKSGQQP
jgi:hypothetical protein